MILLLLAITSLKVDSLPNPLGIDSPKPTFSWVIQDGRRGAAQSAYEVEVASSTDRLAKPDVWDSGRIQSAQSLGIVYGGPALTASTRYFWHVRVWDRKGKEYPVSDAGWWETGLLNQANWQAKWITFEEAEHRRIRESDATWITNASTAPVQQARDTHHDFRFHFDLSGGVKRADLFVTGQDTAAAWVNGKQLLEAQPLVRWGQMPWQSYVKVDVTNQLTTGANVLAIAITHYKNTSSQTNMSACLYVELANGQVALFTTGSPGWRAALDATGDWMQPNYDDASWGGAQKSATDVGAPWPTGPVALLAHDFSVASQVVSARLYATALGSYKFDLNGKPVGDEILAPGWMDFREHVPYQVYDVTALVQEGANRISALLAPGWYTTPLMWFRHGYNYGSTPPALKAQLRIQHADGRVEWIATDESWRGGTSATTSAEIYDGETHDDRITPAANQEVQLVSPKEPEIVAQYFPPIRAELVRSAKAITSPAPGVFIYDFGQNLAGVPRVTISGQRGTVITLRFGEALNPDGTLYVENLRTAKATDHLILSGSGTETWQPQFTFHGFRYAELTGVPSQPPLDALKAVVIHTDAPFTMRLKTGSEMINQLWSNILWGQRSNFVGLPTDCPQRDERLGWSADAQVFWRTAAYDMNLDTFSQKYAADLRGTQVGTPMYGIYAPGVNTPNPGFGTGWSDAGVVVPWTGWLQSGDTRTIDQNWDAMERYLAAIESANPNHLWQHNFGIPFGDWLTPTQTTPEDLIATAYWAYDLSMMIDMAKATGRTDAVQKYEPLLAAVKMAFQQAYVKSDGFVGAPDRYPSIPPPSLSRAAETHDPNRTVETQTGYVLALHMRLVPDNLRAAAAEKLVRLIEANHWMLGTGFLGTPYLLEVLSDTGHSDVAYRLLLNTGYPSWGYLVEHGATTMWERWNGDQMRGDPSMNSYNHYAYGAVGEWIYRYAAGIDTLPENAGFRTIYLHPNFDSHLGSLDLSYDSPYGTVESHWTATAHAATWTVTIPANASGWLPRSVMNGKWKLAKGVEQQKDGIKLPAGTYRFDIRN